MSGWNWVFVAWAGIAAAFLFIYGNGGNSLVSAVRIVLGLIMFIGIFKDS